MEENKDIKIIRKAATELKLPLWRDALDEYISRFAAQSWSVQHLMAVMMQDQLKMRADNRRRTLIKRADFPQLKYLGDLIVDELPDDARTTLPLLLHPARTKTRPVWQSRNRQDAHCHCSGYRSLHSGHDRHVHLRATAYNANSPTKSS